MYWEIPFRIAPFVVSHCFDCCFVVGFCFCFLFSYPVSFIVRYVEDRGGTSLDNKV